jgi:hypothetical protein
MEYPMFIERTSGLWSDKENGQMQQVQQGLIMAGCRQRRSKFDEPQGVMPKEKKNTNVLF